MNETKFFQRFLHILQRIPVGYYTSLWLFIEFLLCLLFMHTEPTYSFDWDAYMEQVSVFRTGLSSKTYEKNNSYFSTEIDKNKNNSVVATDDSFFLSSGTVYQPLVSTTVPVYQYDLLQGDTGPLAYPAGHLWIHNLLSLYYQWNSSYYTTEYTPKEIDGYKYRTHRPVEILYSIQFMYMVLWLATCGVISLVYTRIGLLTNKYPFHIVMLYTIASFTRRTRNIFILGFFNDSWNTFFLWLSIYGFITLYGKTIEYQHRYLHISPSSPSSVSVVTSKPSSFVSSIHQNYTVLFYKNFCSFSSSLFWLWIGSSVLYSFSVSIKMNSLLVAPGILFIFLDTWRIRTSFCNGPTTTMTTTTIATFPNVWSYLRNLSSIQIIFTMIQLMVCAMVQILIARPFLYANPWIYFTSAFNFNRSFELQWSINWNWVPEYFFHSPYFSRLLLLIHLGALLWISNYWIRLLYQDNYTQNIPPFVMFNSVTPLLHHSKTNTTYSSTSNLRKVNHGENKLPIHHKNDNNDDYTHTITVDFSTSTKERLSTVDLDSKSSISSSVPTTTTGGRPRRISYHALDTIHHEESPRGDTSLNNAVTMFNSLTLPSSESTFATTTVFNESTYVAKAAYIIWSSNFIGIVCARSLHYQFLTWYWHSLPIILTSVYSFSYTGTLTNVSIIGLGIPFVFQFFYVLILELGWNHHPPDASSSFIITCLHGIIFMGIVLQASKNNWWHRFGSIVEKFQYAWYRKITNNKQI